MLCGGEFRTVQGDTSLHRKTAGWTLNQCADVDNTRRKLVIIGDGACGKTSLLSVFTLGYFPTVSDASAALLSTSMANFV